MATKGQTLEEVIAQAQRLSPDDQLRLIKEIAERLISMTRAKQHRPLVYGEFKGDRMSTDEDFLIAEWHPSEKDLDGA